MKQQHFEARYQKTWEALEQSLQGDDKSLGLGFPDQFRELCHQLALAKHRRYSPQLVDRLNELVIRAHHRFYKHNHRYHFQWLLFLVAGFPAAVRRNRVFVYVATLLFLLPLLGMSIACYVNPEFIYSSMESGNVRMLETMYDPGNAKVGRERESKTDVLMFGHYIQNNIGISFQTFAGGILFGLGSIFFLVFNGIFIGAAAGHLTQLGYGVTFYPFVAGHGSFELTAIVLSGAAGLKLGYALVNPGQQKRMHALRGAGRDAIIIMYGCIIMLFIAALIEAFWSSIAAISPWIKYTIGIGFWILVISYFIFSGRRYGSQPY